MDAALPMVGSVPQTRECRLFSGPYSSMVIGLNADVPQHIDKGDFSEVLKATQPTLKLVLP